MKITDLRYSSHVRNIIKMIHVKLTVIMLVIMAVMVVAPGGDADGEAGFQVVRVLELQSSGPRYGLGVSQRPRCKFQLPAYSWYDLRQ